MDALAAGLSATAEVAWLRALAVAATLLLAAAWLGATLLRRGTAAARHQVLALGVAGALLLPVLSLALPPLPALESPALDAGASMLMPAFVVTGDRTAGPGPAWPSWLVLAWAAGALLVSLRFLRGHLAARRLARTAEPAAVPAWSAARREAAAALGLTGEVELGRSEAIASPMTIGVLRPRVLLPAAADAWSPERLRAVLLHELGHVRRRDTLTQLGAQLACALYWWNPLAWLAAARLRLEREHACDDLVLAAGVRPSSYAADLLEVARRMSREEAGHAGAVCMADRSGTEARLRRILDPAAPRRPPGARFRLVARGATLALAVALAYAAAPRVLLAPPDPAPAPALVAVAAIERAPRGTLALGVPSVRDRGTPDAVRFPVRAPEDAPDLLPVAAEVERHLGALEECYERRLQVRPTLSGQIIMHWAIQANGETDAGCITHDSLGDAEVLACVNQLIRTATFPPPSAGPLEVSFPFVFAAVR